MAPTSCETPSSRAGLITKTRLGQFHAREAQTVPKRKAVIVGLYGIHGSGKTFLLGQLKKTLGDKHFALYEGSEVIAGVAPGGLDAFKKLGEEREMSYRGLAIDKLGKDFVESGRVGLVAGHFMFSFVEGDIGQPVHIRNDSDTFTHIFYLDTPAEFVAER
jgi:hypothetical protein